MTKTYITIVVLVVAVGGFLFIFNNKKAEAPAVNETETNTQTKEFTVTGANFSFTPSEIAVTKGDKVKITFKNTNGFHDFVIDEFKVATSRINTGGQETVSFIADKSGEFEYYCSVSTHRMMGMKGTLIVTE